MPRLYPNKFSALSLVFLFPAVLGTFMMAQSIATQNATANPVPQNSPSTSPAKPLFKPVVTYSDGGSLSWVLAVADVNGDGKPDVVVANFGATNQQPSVGVLIGNGNGTFQPVTTYDPGGEEPTGIAVGDLNGDGKPDIVLANEVCPGVSTFCVSVLMNRGDGTFEPAVSYADGGLSWAGGEGILTPITITDVNGDGKPDVVVINQTDKNYGDGLVSILLGNGDGTFKPVTNYSTGGFAAIAGTVVDVNGDGKLDVVVANCGPRGTICPSAHGSVGVLLGNGDGTFKPVKKFLRGGMGGLFPSLVVTDLNGDGKPDIIVGNSCPTTCNATFAVLLGNGNGTFQKPVPYNSGGQNVQALGVADLNGDGIPDIVASSGVNSVWLGNGDGTFRAGNTYPPGGNTGQIFLTDLNDDGKIDFVGINGTSSTVDVRLGNGDGTFQDFNNFALGGSQYTWATVADINGDTKQDILSANWCTPVCTNEQGTVGVLLNSPSRFPTTTSMVSSLNPSLVGQPVSFTATVTSPAGPPPDGDVVSFSDGSTLLGSARLSKGIAVFTTSSLTAGTHSILAHYPGGHSTFAASSSRSVRQVVTNATTTSLNSSANPSAHGQTVTFTATVTSSGSSVPTGTVTFKNGTTAIGHATLSAGTAMLTTSKLATGTDSITADYSGDAVSAKSTSSILLQVIN